VQALSSNPSTAKKKRQKERKECYGLYSRTNSPELKKFKKTTMEIYKLGVSQAT
jgi:hypothetical protein